MDAAWAMRLVVTALLLPLASAGGSLSGGAVANAYAANSSLESYRFTMHGTIVMHSFPWLHLPIDGQGVYERGRRYEVHLTHVPFFAKAFGRIDLSALAPQMWPGKFDVTDAGMQNGREVYTLRDRSDPSVAAETVWVDPVRGIREVLVRYANGGDVDLHVRCADRRGYLVPASTDADVDVPGARLSVQAAFGDYRVVTGRSLVGATHTR